MKSRIQVVLTATVMAAIGVFGFFETLEAAPDGTQRLRGMEGRAFLVEGFLLDEFGNVVGENPPGGTYCYFFNSDSEWIDARFFGGVPGTWEQDSVGAATGYSASAAVQIDAPAVFLALAQTGRVTPAQGSGVLQLKAVTDVLINIFDEEGELQNQILLFQLLTLGHEVPDCIADPD